MEVGAKVGGAIVEFFAKEDTGHLVTASILSLSILMTIALLSQGSQDSVFQYGFGIYGQKQASERIQEQERQRDEAEEEIFQSPIEKIQVDEEIGADLFLASKIPLITVVIAIVVVAGGVHVALFTPA